MPSNTALTDGCDGPLPGDVRRGLSLFNRGCFFEQHEQLEAAWPTESVPL